MMIEYKRRVNCVVKEGYTVDGGGGGGGKKKKREKKEG